VGNVKHKGLDVEAQPELYLPFLQYLGTPLSTLVLRTDSDPTKMIAAMRKTIREFEPDQPIMGVRTMEQVAYDSLAQPRFYTLLLGIFSALAVILASVGIYGVMSYSVVQQQHEIGIRMALGATAGQLVRQTAGAGVTLAIVGVLLGAGLATAAVPLLQSLLWGVRLLDPLTYGAAAAGLLLVAAVASIVPARRVTRFDPSRMLRSE